MAPTSPSKVKESVAADEAVAAEAAAKSEAQKAEVEADLEEALGGMVFRWVFPWFFRWVFLWFSDGFPMGISKVFCGFPMVFRGERQRGWDDGDGGDRWIMDGWMDGWR